MKYILFISLALFFIVGCSEQEYQPTDFEPDIDDGVEAVFPDSIAGLKANVKFEFMNDSCKSISATYGDHNDIYIQILLVDRDYASPKECLADYILPKFDAFKKVKKNYNNFYATVSTDVFHLFSWNEHKFCYFLKCKNQYLDAVVGETDYIEYK